MWPVFSRQSSAAFEATPTTIWVLMLCILLIAVLVAYSPTVIESAQPLSIPTHQPRLYAQQVTQQVFSDEGSLAYSLYTPKLVAYAQQSELLQPHIEFFDQGRVHWQLHAQKATAYSELLVFNDDVVLEEHPITPQRLMVHTQQLHYHTQQQLMTSEVAVTLQQGAQITQGIGLKGQLLPKQTWMKLLAQVQTQLWPQTQGDL